MVQRYNFLSFGSDMDLRFNNLLFTIYVLFIYDLLFTIYVLFYYFVISPSPISRLNNQIVQS